MDKKLRKEILKILKEHDKVVYLSGITEKLFRYYKYQQTDVFVKRVRDYLRILGDAGYVLIRESQPE